MNIFKISYQWYEEDCGTSLLGKNCTKEEFEKDLIEAKNFAQSLIGIETEDSDYLGKGYRVDCLPEYYRQIIWFLMEKKGYVDCDIDEDVEYFVDDDMTKSIDIKRKVEKTDWEEVTTGRSN